MNAKEFILKCRNDIVFFIEHVLVDEEGQHYKVEPHQEAMMTSTEGQVCYFCGRRLGKSFMLAAESIHRAVFFKYQKIFVLSPTEEQATELADTISGMIERAAMVENEIKKDNVMTKRFKNGSRIKIRTAGGRGNVSSMIGSGANLLIIDEVQDVSSDLISKIIPIQRGQKGASKFIISGTPRDRSGFLYESLENAPKMWDDGKWEEHPERSGTFVVYRQQSCYLDEDEAKVIRSSTPRITIKEFQEDMANMPHIQFMQEYCLDFIATVSDVYSEELRSQVLYDQDSIAFGSINPVVAGVDVGKMRNNTVLYIAEVIPAPQARNKSYKILDLKWHKTFPLGTKYSEIENYLIDELPAYFPKVFRIVVDATGVGEAIWENVHDAMVKKGDKIAVEPFKFTKEKKKDLVESCLAALERGQVKVPWNQRLNKEMAGYKREVTDSNNYVYQKTAGSDDYVDAMNLCIHNISLGLINSVPVSFQTVPKTLPKKFGQVRKGRFINAAQKQNVPRGLHNKILNSNRRRF